MKCDMFDQFVFFFLVYFSWFDHLSFRVFEVFLLSFFVSLFSIHVFILAIYQSENGEGLSLQSSGIQLNGWGVEWSGTFEKGGPIKLLQ